MNKIIGNIIELADKGHFDVIVHQANCFCTMGKGIALSLRQKWSEVYEADLNTHKGDRSKLGDFSVANVKNSHGDDLLIVNLYSQYSMAKSKREVVTDYDAMRKGLQTIADNLEDNRLAIPYKIGCNNANGDWSVVESIITEIFHGKNVTIVRK